MFCWLYGIFLWITNLNFVPLTKKTDEFTVKEDTEKFLRRVKLKAHFHDKEQPSDKPQRRFRIAQTEEV